MCHKHITGFTLIELIICMAILSILASIAIPNTASYIEGVKKMKAVNTAKEIHTVVTSSYSSNEGNFSESDISELIKQCTDAEEVRTVQIADDLRKIDINYVSDNKDYFVSVGSEGNYVVKDYNGNQIFQK